MARRYRQDRIDPETLRKMEEQIRVWERGEGEEPCYIWSGGKPDFPKPKKGSVEFTDCQTTNCAGKARHATSSYPGALLRWFWQPNSFYCWPCVWKRGAIATCMMAALILAAGLVLMLLPTVGIGWTLLAIPVGAVALYKLLDWGLKASR